MEIVLHLGLHRTGTTALQGALRRARARLAEDGVEAPSTAALRRGTTGALDLALAAGPAGGARRAFARSRIRRLARRAERRGVRRLVLSDEAMIGHLDTLFAAGGPYPDAAARLGLLAEAFEGWPVRAAVALRDPADWIASSYAFAAAMRPQPAFDDLRVPLMQAPARLGAALRAAAETFPGLAVWTTDAAKAQPRLPLRLLVGAAARDVRPVRNARNISLSGPAVARLQELRAMGEPVDDAVREALAARWPMERHGPFDPWSAAERAALAAAMDREVAALRAAGARVIDGAARPRAAAGRGR